MPSSTTNIKSEDSQAPITKVSQGISKEVIQKLTEEINNMLSFAIFNGIIINTNINSLIQSNNVDDLINAHNLLCKNIAPATPKSIQFTKKLHQKSDGKSVFNKIPLLRNLVFVSILFLVTYVITGMTPEVNISSLDKGIMNNSGLSLLLNIFYLGAVSGLGVLFYLLKEVSESLKKGALIPENAIYYITQILLGIISGIIASEFIGFYTTDLEKINLYNKSVLALIGGFSSDAVINILQGIVNKIKSIFITSN